MEIKYVSLLDARRLREECSVRVDTMFFDKDRRETFGAPDNFFASQQEINDSLWFFQLKPRIVNSAPVYISVVRGVFVLPCGVVVTDDGSVVVESIYPRMPKEIVKAEELFGSERDLELFRHLVEGSVNSADVTHLTRAVHGRDIGEQGYFHWIATVLPRISLVADRFSGDTGPYLLNPHPNFGWDWLTQLGLHENICCPDANMLYVDELIFPSPSQVGDSHYTRNPMLLLDFKKRLVRSGILSVSEKDRGCGNNIYITRSDAPVRRLVNEDDLLESVSAMGFNTLCLTGMSVHEQVDLFASAQTVVGPHGAGLVNVLFGSESTTVIELMSPTRTWPGFKVIAKMVGSKYCSFVSDSYDDTHTDLRGYGNEDFFVDVGTCSRFIESCLPPLR